MAEGWAKRWTVGDRLNWAIHTHQAREGRSLGVGLLIRKLEARAETHGEKAVGATYPSIASYLKGETEPPLTFLRAVADVLEVNLAWLALGEGAPTKAHAEAAEVTDDSVAAVQEPESMLGSRLNTSVQLKLGLPLDWVARNRHLRSWVAPIAEAWVTLAATPTRQEPEDMIGSALRGPIDAMGLDVQRTVPPTSEFLTRYIFAMVPVLMGLVDERQRQERHIHGLSDGLEEDERERLLAETEARKEDQRKQSHLSTKALHSRMSDFSLGET